MSLGTEQHGQRRVTAPPRAEAKEPLRTSVRSVDLAPVDHRQAPALIDGSHDGRFGEFDGPTLVAGASR